MPSFEDVLYPSSRSERLLSWLFVAAILLLQLAVLAGFVYLVWHMWLFEISLISDLIHRWFA
jgi:hypothetical protein